MKKISIVSACYNEEDNILPFYNSVINELSKLEQYDYEFIVIDNKSNDKTRDILIDLASKNHKFKVIFNSKNFGALKSPFYAMQQASGDCMIYIASDLQDPPSLIPELLKCWEDGYKIAIGVKTKSKESKLMWILRQIFYKFINAVESEDSNIIENYTGYGVYDRTVVELMKQNDDPTPDMKSILSDIGFDIKTIEYTQQARKHGKSKYNLLRLYSCAMNIITKHSFFPIRLATFSGFILAMISMLISIIYLFLKIFHWESYELGMASLIIGLFFFSSVQLFFIGILGEYIGAIYTRVNKKPLVVVERRFNFDE